MNVTHNVKAVTEFLDSTLNMCAHELTTLGEKIYEGDHAEFFMEFLHHGDAEFTKHSMFDKVKTMYLNAYC